jgi:hypothetical protein
MTPKRIQPPPAGSKRSRNSKQRATPVSNAALNQQNRRVLAQHYRAKYGVK